MEITIHTSLAYLLLFQNKQLFSYLVVLIYKYILYLLNLNVIIYPRGV